MSNTKKTTVKARDDTNSIANNVLKAINLNFKSICSFLVVVITVLSISYVYITSFTGASYMINASDQELKDIFFGTKPFLHVCNPEGEDEINIPTSFIEATKRIGLKNIGLSALNCSQLLPSGKTIYERFKLNKNWNPKAFTTAPWSKPSQLTQVSMKSTDAIETFVKTYTSPKPIVVTSDKEYKDNCKFNTSLNNICFVFFKGRRYTFDSEIIIKQFVQDFPGNRVVIVDAKHRKFSFESPPANFELYAYRLFAIKNYTSYHSLQISPSLQHMQEYAENIVSGKFDSKLMTYKDNKEINLIKYVSKKTQSDDERHDGYDRHDRHGNDIENDNEDMKEEADDEEGEWRSGNGQERGGDDEDDEYEEIGQGQGKAKSKSGKAKSGKESKTGNTNAADGDGSNNKAETNPSFHDKKEEMLRQKRKEDARREAMEREQRRHVFDEDEERSQGQGREESEVDEEIIEL